MCSKRWLIGIRDNYAAKNEPKKFLVSFLVRSKNQIWWRISGPSKTAAQSQNIWHRIHATSTLRADFQLKNCEWCFITLRSLLWILVVNTFHSLIDIIWYCLLFYFWRKSCIVINALIWDKRSCVVSFKVVDSYTVAIRQHIFRVRFRAICNDLMWRVCLNAYVNDSKRTRYST